MADGRRRSKDWLPEVPEPVGVRRVSISAYKEEGDELILMGAWPALRAGEMWLKVEGQRFLVAEEDLAYAVASVRKARAAQREAGR